MSDADALVAAYEAGLAFEKSGDSHAAETEYKRCLALDPSDQCGASVRLASLGLAPAPAKAPDAYVATLFDQHAAVFDDILTGQLRYAVPMQLAAFLERYAPGPYARMVDLGCGTGLSGETLQAMCAYAVGVDISEQMVEQADERAVYDALFVNEVVHFLAEYAASDEPEHGPFDLLVATDVLPYIGALEPLFEGLAANAADKAIIALSSETLPDDAFGPDGWTITPHQRFAHHKSYLLGLCAQYGFSSVLHFEDITVRLEQASSIPGYLLVAQKP